MTTAAPTPMDGWNTLSWKTIARGVFKLQKRIDQAQRHGKVQMPITTGNCCTDTAMTKRRLKTVEGMLNTHQTLEESCAGQLARTVLKQRRGERFPRLL